MKAIIKVSKHSAYAKYNGQSFEVVEVLSQLIALAIPNECGQYYTTDFGFSEVKILDIQKEMQQAYDNFNWGSDCRTFAGLQGYCQIKKISPQIQYNCPN